MKWSSNALDISEQVKSIRDCSVLNNITESMPAYIHTHHMNILFHVSLYTSEKPC